MYPTTAELVAASTVAALTDLETAQQDALRQEAILTVEGHCAQSFEAEGTEDDPVTKTLDGVGGRTLYLPMRMAKLVSVTPPEGSSLSTGDVTLSDDHDRLAVRSLYGGTNWATQAFAEGYGYRDLRFPSEPASVKVAGVWGWTDDEFPAAIATALRFDMEDRALADAHALSETVRSARALGLTALNQGGLTMQFGQRTGALGAVPGEPAVSTRVERLLSGFLWVSMAGSMA